MQFRAKLGGTLAQSPSATHLNLLRMQYLESRSRRARCQDFQRAEVLTQKCAGLLGFDPNAVDPDGNIRGRFPVWDGRLLFSNPWFTPSSHPPSPRSIGRLELAEKLEKSKGHNNLGAKSSIQRS